MSFAWTSPCARLTFSSLRRVGHWAGSLALLTAFGLGCARPVAAPPSAPTPTAEVASPVRPTSNQVPVEGHNPMWGNQNAPVTVVAFLDFQCPFCSRVHPTLVELLHKYGPERLRLVVKHAPLPFHERALPAAKAAQAVYRLKGVDAFLAYASALYDLVSEGGTDVLTDAQLQAAATEVGVSAQALAAEVAKPEVAKDLEVDLRSYEQLGVEGVPGFLINGARLSGARPVGDFETLIEHELVAAEELKRREVEAGAIYDKRVQVNYRLPQPFPEERPFEDVAYRVPLGKSPARGPSDAPVTIVEFADIECPYCERAHATVEQVLAKFPGKVRWVMKNNPLPFHPVATPAAITASEIRRQKGDEAYWAALDRFYRAEAITPDLLLDVADDMGVASKPLLALFEADTLPAEIQADQDLAIDLGAQGTPQFFVNGRRMAGAQPLSVFEQLVQQELDKVAELGLRGDVYAALQSKALPPPGLVRHELPPTPQDTPVLGPAEAPVTIVMFADFECPFCQRVLPTLAALRARYPNRLKLVWHQLPLPFHPHAKQAAAAALEARKQRGPDGYWAMAERLMAMPGVFLGAGYQGDKELPELPELSVDFLRQQARELALDESKFTEAMNGGAHQQAISADQQLARQLGVTGTPTFFINGYSLSGAQPFERFERLVRLALEQASATAAER